MISNENIMNTKVVELVKMYKLYFGHFSIRLCLNNPNFEFQNMTTRCKYF
jgi:hypothetical protein